MIINKTKNTIRSSIWGFVNRIVTLICPFITRTCIIYILGTEYVGLNSLFTSIISVLSLAELGFGTAIVYSMYEPIANGNDRKICALMNLYRKVYRIMGMVVLGVGIAIIPFLPYFIKDDLPADINLYLLYGIYLFNSVLSYWLFAYKNCLLAAYQRNDVSFKISTISSVAMYFFQFIALAVFKNYYYFVICIPIFSATNNVITASCVKRMYPQYVCKGKIDDIEYTAIKKQVVGLLAQRLAYSSRNAFDSIIISAFLGLTVVGIYNNYFYILNAVTAILSLLFTSMQGGIGNSIVKDSVQKNYKNFKMINFMYMWIAGWCSICLLVLMQDFMKIWVGKEFMFSNIYVVLFAFYFWAMKMTDTVGAYIAGTGIWWKCRYTYLVEAFANLILNIGLGYVWGTIGVIIATILSVVFVNFLSNTYILFKYYFRIEDVKEYLLSNIKYTATVILASIITYCVANLIPSGETRGVLIFHLLLKFTICLIIGNVLFILLYYKSKQFDVSKQWMLSKVRDSSKKKV